MSSPSTRPDEGEGSRRADPATATGATAFAAALPWVARLGWILVAVLGGAAVESAVADRGGTVGWTAAVMGWGAWAAVALALAVPSVPTLTLVRVGSPVALVVALGSLLWGASAADVAALAIPAAVTVAAVTAAEFGRAWIQASAYGDESRFPLRPPAAAGAAALVTWLLWAPCLVAGPVLLADGTWAAGAICTVVAVTGAVLLGPRWHRLSQRWFVMVPAGIALRDPVVLADTLPLRTNQLAAIRLAPADTQAADLTGPASGYAVEVTTTETVTAVFAFTPQEPDGRAIHLNAFLVAPSRPGAALRTAAERGLPVR